MNFADILNTNVGDVERPPLPPVGSYLFTVKSHEFKAYDKKDGPGKWQAIEFVMQAVAPGEDIDPDAIAEFGNVNRIVLRKSFLADDQDARSMEETAWRVKEFITKHLGVEGEGTLNELISSAKGAQCIGIVEWQPRRDNPGEYQANLKSTASAG